MVMRDVNPVNNDKAARWDVLCFTIRTTTSALPSAKTKFLAQFYVWQSRGTVLYPCFRPRP